MKITIHRGLNQIGGCITEIQSLSGTKILIDLGHNLPDGGGVSEDRKRRPCGNGRRYSIFKGLQLKFDPRKA